MASSISEAARRRSAVPVAMLAAVAVAVGALPTARAQPSELAQPAIETEANREAARAKLVEGVAALKRGDHQAALTRFEEAYALVPSPKIHYDFGLAYVGLGRTADALAAFERFLAEAPDAPPDTREKAASLIPTLRARLAEAAPRNDGQALGAAPPPAGAQGATSGQVPGAVSPPPEARLAAAPTANDDSLRTRRITAMSVGAAGAGLLAAGLVFGALARQEGDSLTHDSQMGTWPVRRRSIPTRNHGDSRTSGFRSSRSWRAPSPSRQGRRCTRPAGVASSRSPSPANPSRARPCG